MSFPVGSLFGQLECPGFHQEGVDDEAQTSQAVVAAAACSFWKWGYKEGAGGLRSEPRNWLPSRSAQQPSPQQSLSRARHCATPRIQRATVCGPCPQGIPGLLRETGK